MRVRESKTFYTSNLVIYYLVITPKVRLLENLNCQLLLMILSYT